VDTYVGVFCRMRGEDKDFLGKKGEFQKSGSLGFYLLDLRFVFYITQTAASPPFIVKN
jgi:hypothetical protein